MYNTARDRQTDRQRDRQTERQTAVDTDIEADRVSEMMCCGAVEYDVNRLHTQNSVMLKTEQVELYR